MVAATQSHQSQLPFPAAAAASSSSSTVEDTLKRNTDCVYFLASPLTCKKGNECEYRHSEYARVNPRDCYFWLNGNCLNPKCGFRHPPLDGLVGIQGTASAGSSVPPARNNVPPTAHTPNSSGKQAVPCLFFQKGLCVRGDKCAFMHGQNPTTNNVHQPKAPTPVPAPKAPSKSVTTLQQHTQDQMNLSRNFPKAVQAMAEPKSLLQRSSVGVEPKSLPPKGVNDEVLKMKATENRLVSSESSIRFNPQHSPAMDGHGYHNGWEIDETMRESPPGFYVLVDDDVGDSVYDHEEDHYGGTSLHDRRNLVSVDGYGIDHSTNYGPTVHANRQAVHDAQVFDSYDHIPGQYDKEHQRASSDRVLVAAGHRERRGYSKANAQEHIDESDLRHRLSKHRRADGLRSVVSSDFIPSNHGKESSHHGSSRRDSHHLPSRDSSISSRLQGRIKLPVSPNGGSDQHSEREMDLGRNWGRISAGRSDISHRRVNDRLSSRHVESPNNEGRNFRASRIRRDVINEKGTNFDGPKSLAELKGVTKTERTTVHHSLGKRKQSEDNQPLEGDLLFDGPMPLSEILKRKRKAGSAASGIVESANKETSKESNESLIGSSKNKPVEDTMNSMSENKEEPSPAIAVSAGNVEGVQDEHGQISELAELNELETGDAKIVYDGIEDQEYYEGEYQGDGDYEYDQEGEYEYEEVENGEEEEEYGGGENVDGAEAEEYVEEED